MTDIPFHFELTDVPPATGELVNMIAIQACEAHEERRLMTVHPEIVLALTTLIEQNRETLFAPLQTFTEELDFDDAMETIFGKPKTVMQPMITASSGGKYSPYPNGMAQAKAFEMRQDGFSEAEIEARIKAFQIESELDDKSDSRVWRAAKEKEMQMEGFSEAEIRRVMEAV